MIGLRYEFITNMSIFVVTFIITPRLTFSLILQPITRFLQVVRINQRRFNRLPARSLSMLLPVY
jgi:hypothetical protein